MQAHNPLLLMVLHLFIIHVLVTSWSLPCSASSTTVTVCPAGGTPCDFSSIGAAIRAAVSDTLINVQASSYSETSGPTTSLVPLTLSFQGVGSTVEGPHWDVWLRVNSTVNVFGNLRLVGALEIGSQGRLEQQDRLTVVPPANFKCNATGWLAGRSFGVALSEGEWHQNGVVNVTLVSDYPANGVISRPESESGCKWEQKADAFVRVESSSQAVGVSLGQDMEWIQTAGRAVVSVVSTTNTATAVYLEGDSEWKQTTEATLSSSARGTLAATGVALFGGNWGQSAPANLTVSGPTGSAGVQTSLAAIGSASGDAGTWVQEAPVSINWSGAAGHGFSCKDAGDWRCLTDDLTGLAGGVHIAEQDQGQCEWAMGYVPALPSGFSVQCESTYDSNAFLLPAALSPYLTGCAASTVVPTVALFDNSAMTAARGVVYEFIVTKDLLPSAVNFNFSVSYGNGSLDTSSNSIAPGLGNTTISMRSSVNGSGSGSLQLLPELGSFALSKFRIALTFVTLFILNTPSADENIALVLSFNVSAPIIGVNPSRGSTDDPVGLNLVEIEEVAPNGTVVRTASALKGEWSIGQVPDDVGAAQTYRFSADLLGSNDTQFGLRWYLFDRPTNVSVPSIISDEPLAASPEFAKMTFQISPSWPWLSADNTLRLHMKVSPGFSSVTVRPDTPQLGVTSYELAIDSAGGDESKPRTAVVRLLGAALSKAEDGTLARVNVEHVANEAESEVVLSFAHFDGTLIFDPDFSVVVGSKKGESSSDDGLVVAVAVAVPVAVVAVAAVILVALVAGVVSKRRYAKRAQSQLTAISIGPEDLEEL